MRRTRQLRPDNFPFLAVLLCAMGALILVLMALDRRARMAARQRTQQAEETQRREQDDLLAKHLAKQEAQREAERLAREQRLSKHQAEVADLRSQQDQLRADFERVQADVAAAERAYAIQKKQASDLEAQRGVEVARTAEAAKLIAERQARIDMTGKKLEAAKTERQRLADLLRQLEVAMARIKEQRDRDKQKFSVIPYVGKRGFNGRPLYVECSAYGLTFHPDRFVLASATMTEESLANEMRKRMEQRQQSTTKPDEPVYWMLIVRPDGIENYYRFQVVARPLELTYGYEFVEPDWQLEFPDPATVPVATGPAVPLRPAVGVSAASPRQSQSSGAPAGPLTGGTRPGTLRNVIAGSPGSGGPRVAGVPGAGPRRPGFPRTVGEPGALATGVPGTGAPRGTGERVGEPGALATGVPGTGVPRGTGERVGEPGALATGVPGSGVPRGTGERVGEPGALATGVPGSGVPRGTGERVGEPGALATGVPRIGNPQNTSPQPQLGQPEATPTGSSPTDDPFPSLTPPIRPPEGSSDSDPPLRVRQPGASGNGTAEKGSPTTGGTSGAGEGAAPAAGSADRSRLAGPADKRPASPPPPLRPAPRYDDEWVLTVECRADGVQLLPSQVFVPLVQLYAEGGGDRLLVQTAMQSLQRRKAVMRAGDPPLKAYIRFVVRRDGLRAFHLAYPALISVPAEKSTVVTDE